MSKGMSVLSKMQETTRDLQKMLLTDVNKVAKCISDRILAKTRKYEHLIQRVNLDNERLRGRAKMKNRVVEQVSNVSECTRKINENVCLMNDAYERTCKRLPSGPVSTGQDRGDAGQPKSYAVIVRGANEELSTAEVRKRMDERVCPEVNFCARAVRPARGRGVIVETRCDIDTADRAVLLTALRPSGGFERR